MFTGFCKQEPGVGSLCPRATRPWKPAYRRWSIVPTIKTGNTPAAFGEEEEW